MPPTTLNDANIISKNHKTNLYPASTATDQASEPITFIKSEIQVPQNIHGDNDMHPYVQNIKHEPEIIIEELDDSSRGHLSDEAFGSELSYETYSIKFFGEQPANTDEQRLKRMEYNRQYNRMVRANETPEQRACRLEKLRQQRASETPEQRSRRLECMRHQNESIRQLRKTESAEERRKRLEKQKLERDNEDAEKRAERLRLRRLRQAEYRAKETPEQRVRRLEYNRNYSRNDYEKRREKAAARKALKLSAKLSANSK